MSRAVNAIVIGVAVFVLLAGSIWYVMVAREPNRIKTTTDRDWEGGEGDRFRAVVTFENPYDYDVTLLRYDYKYLVNGNEWGGGGDEPRRVLKPHTKTQVNLVVNITVDGVSAWFKSHVANDEESVVQLRGEAIFSVPDRNRTVSFGYRESFQTNILESIADADLCSGAKDVCFGGAEGRWVEKDKAVVLQLDAQLRNPTDDRADLGNASFDVIWNGVTVGNAKTSGGAIDPGDDLTAEFLVFFEHAKLVQWWAQHTADCETSRAQAILRLEVRYVPEGNDDPTESPTPSSAPPTNTTTSSPSPTTTTTASPTTTSTPPPTTSSTPPPTNTTYETQNIVARAEVGSPAVELDPVRTAFVCTHD